MLSLKLLNETDIVKEFSEIDFTNVAIVTGVNGSGKTQLLNLIKRGVVQSTISGQVIATDRIIFLDSNVLSGFSYLVSMENYHGVLQHELHFQVKEGFLNELIGFTTQMADTSELIKQLITKMYGVLPEEMPTTLIEAIKNKNIEDIMNSIPRVGNYIDSITPVLQNYYHRLAAIELRDIAAQRIRLPEISAPITNVESLVNDIFVNLNLPYEIFGGQLYVNYKVGRALASVSEGIYHVPDEENWLGGGYKLKLKNLNDGSIIDIDWLSAGEKALVRIASLVIFKALAGDKALKPKIILLDEPDAHLHPKYISTLFSFFESTFVKQFDLHIIITTHSPITASIANSASFAFMSNGSILIVDKQQSVSQLLIGVPEIQVSILDKIYTFVESEDDVHLYEYIFSVISSYNSFLFRPVFIASSNGKGGNREQVIHILSHSPSNKSFRGVVDWDLSDSQIPESVYVFAKGTRYAIENAIFDPMCLIVYILSRGVQLSLDLGLPPGINARTFISRTELHQTAVSNLVQFIFSDIDYLDTLEIHYSGGFKVSVCKTFLHIRGHDLEDKIVDKIRQLRANRPKYDMVKIFREYPELIPLEFIDMFNELFN